MGEPTLAEEPLTEEEREALNTAVNESDLYLTYRQVDKAIQPLEAILERMPRCASCPLTSFGSSRRGWGADRSV